MEATLNVLYTEGFRIDSDSNKGDGVFVQLRKWETGDYWMNDAVLEAAVYKDFQEMSHTFTRIDTSWPNTDAKMIRAAIEEYDQLQIVNFEVE